MGKLSKIKKINILKMYRSPFKAQIIASLLIYIFKIAIWLIVCDIKNPNWSTGNLIVADVILGK